MRWHPLALFSRLKVCCQPISEGVSMLSVVTWITLNSESILDLLKVYHIFLSNYPTINFKNSVCYWEITYEHVVTGSRIELGHVVAVVCRSGSHNASSCFSIMGTFESKVPEDIFTRTGSSIHDFKREGTNFLQPLAARLATRLCFFDSVSESNPCHLKCTPRRISLCWNYALT